ncbi:DEAD/DEAH box helicase [Herbaspirillum sp. RTI4]|uniref:DEAD/DEAH box helicase n=1 Tax=Herbaspirillum sp. RTI4 TaxID=3048640 RepID=UPI002AB5317E|nr:DEAD/DEAH box helicase [Herbaspirillum sp. RTI4]MDY7579386.1 DEAD/DEAH box helicase [Herbaspirillum sp. RTI4]MEA9980300.1 DEAD/DEAH box helicase [Herbaspirillum sp. RTI4]
MAIDFKPHGYQVLIIAFIQTMKRCAIWAGMGLGKTVSTLTALEELSLVEDVYPILVLAPLRVARTTWPQEVRKWNHLKHLQVMPICGGLSERQAALRVKVQIYTTNYEQLPWLVEYLGEKWPFKTIVVDEATKLKGFRLRQGTQRAKALARVAHTRVKRIILLTGTPSPNGLQDLWGQMWFVDAGQRLGRTFDSFKQRWFRKSHTGFGVDATDEAQGQIQAALGDVCITIDAADWFDLQKPIVNTILLTLPPKAAILYKDMEKKMFMELEGNEIEALNAAAKTMKCLQIANGAAYLDGGVEWKTIHDEKLDALEEIIEESGGMPVLVAYHFKSDLARLKARFPEGRQLDARSQTIDDWNAGKIPLMFAHPASAGHGLNLQDGSNILAFFSVNWNLEEHQQIIERIGPVRQLQAGHKRPVFIHFILAADTVDEMILERLQTKREVQDILLDAMKTKGYA